MKTQFAILACIIAVVAGCEEAPPVKSANDVADVQKKLDAAKQELAALAAKNCAKDTDCKDDRVCNAGACVERQAPPKPNQPPGAPKPGAPLDASALQQQRLASGIVIWVPVASGAFCSAQESLRFDLNNYADDWLAEVRGPLVGLNCDGGSFATPTVMRRNGVADKTWAVPPDTNAMFVTLPLNGGVGNVTVNIDLFLNLGPQAPAPAIGYLKDRFHFPRLDGGHHFHDIREGGGGIQFYSLLEVEGSGDTLEMVKYDSLSEEQIDGLVPYLSVIPNERMATLLRFVPPTRIAMFLSPLPSDRIAQLEELTHTSYQL